MFNSGIRPAVDSGLSVSRVGSAAQIKAMKQVSGSLKLDLAQYHEMEAFARFGSDLDPSTKKILDHGARLEHLLVQKQYSPMSVAEQVLVLYAAQHGYLDTVELYQIQTYQEGLLQYVAREYPLIMDRIEQEKKIDDALEADINTAMDAYAKLFALSEGSENGGK